VLNIEKSLNSLKPRIDNTVPMLSSTLNHHFTYMRKILQQSKLKTFAEQSENAAEKNKNPHLTLFSRTTSVCVADTGLKMTLFIIHTIMIIIAE